MATSTMTNNGRTTVPREVREALGLKTGDKLTWELDGGHRVVVKTGRAGLWRLEGFIKHGPSDPEKAVADARKRRVRI